MQVSINPRFMEQGKRLLELNESHGFVIAEISGLESKDAITLEDIHLPDPEKILVVSSERMLDRSIDGFEAILAPGYCRLTENYHNRMKGKNIIGYAGRCILLQPTISDLRYSQSYLSAGIEKAVLAFFYLRKGCAIYGIGNSELSIFSQDTDSLQSFPQTELGKYLERAVLYRTRSM